MRLGLQRSRWTCAPEWTRRSREGEHVGEARSHHADLFMNRRANRLKVLVHDGFGLWLCARRLQQGHFIRPSTHLGTRFELSMSQLQALAVGLPWERLNEHANISIL